MYSSIEVQDPTASVPISYALLELPSKKELRKKGYKLEEINTTSTRDHPLSKWTTHMLRRGVTYRHALDAIQEANKNSWGLLKARINFSCGSFDSYARLKPHDPMSLKHVGSYDPNGVYKLATIEASVASRARLFPRLKPLVDERGYHTCKKSVPRSFAPQVLYKDCPPPVLSQAGYDFTPVSHTAFLLRPGDHPRGVRNVKSDFMKESCDYRPRSYLRDEVSGGVNSRHCHCAEVYQVGDYTADYARVTDVVNQRNAVVQKDFTKTGTLKANSSIVGRRYAKAPTFPCTHHVSAKGGDTTATAAAAEPQQTATTRSNETPNEATTPNADEPMQSQVRRAVCFEDEHSSKVA
ncbi:hypothetical protein TraAM80_05581 [Trypanosoma rangeli]|uniref:Uncharacterized protein n=1 Tax=Trypanosoma rangeli TaxID=5698 RepID=A0A3R7NJS2_TRYRA|nr:uncharacterized protein TraAM80_05581 [Trypanosoma rangeli]RNF03641.1 hypothetical protein TraAM80_05581 [Trypanosoma rangeli]|eukprot:RNF03641.1 hypothetical protein TraAM80_05581 [Trypanosoma rangeli]